MKRADHVLCLLALAIVFVDAARAQAPPKQAVVETSAGTFVIDLAPDAAPNQTISSARQPRRRSTASTPPSAESSTGMTAVEAIEAAPRTGEAPVTRIELRGVAIGRK